MTGLLYPRLLEAAARGLRTEFLGLSVDEIRLCVAYQNPAGVFAATGGHRVTTSQLEALRSAVLALAEDGGYPGGGRRLNHVEFDLSVARLLHERSGLVAAEAAVRPIWAFLALVVLPDISFWRYPKPPGDRVLATDITRHVWGRLWWRAHLTFDPSSADGYELLPVFGEAAFDQIFARRAVLGGSRPLIRAVARSWPRVDRRGLVRRGLSCLSLRDG